jgi:hypothetical protein
MVGSVKIGLLFMATQAKHEILSSKQSQQRGLMA